ncbi:MAG: ATP-binding protein, partial [Allomuricauda sp.]
MSFLVSPFPITIELIKPTIKDRNFYLNGLITESTVKVDENGSQIKWNRFIQGNKLPLRYDMAGAYGIKLFENLQSFVSGALVSKHTSSLPSTQLRLNDKDKVLLTHLHDYSDWVITFDKNLGPQIFDQPSKDGKIPFLLDYVPGEEALGISSYLTTRPTSEVLGLLGPHFEEFNLDIHNVEDEHKIKILLEDLRAVSSSLVLQLNSSKNKAFEVIGSAFTKRVLEKKEMLEDAFLIPIDLHQNLFENLPSGSKSRADNLLVSIDPNQKEILISVIEIKCRRALGENEKDALRLKMLEQIENTIEALRNHFDPSYNNSFDRLDREIKNKELKSLLTFYLERAHRYEYLSNKAYNQYLAFLQKLDSGFSLHFRKLGLIFDFAASERHKKVVLDNESTFFTFGGKLIDDILDPYSDLNTKRLEESDLDKDLTKAFGNISELKPFIQRFKSKLESSESASDSSGDDEVENSTKVDSRPDKPLAISR